VEALWAWALSADWGRILYWVWQILQGLVYIHGQSPPIVHRDLKPLNVLVSVHPAPVTGSRETAVQTIRWSSRLIWVCQVFTSLTAPGGVTLKLCDFGVAALDESVSSGGANRMNTVCGSPFFISPEVLRWREGH
jgi:serine/threonine protein kinase